MNTNDTKYKRLKSFFTHSVLFLVMSLMLAMCSDSGNDANNATLDGDLSFEVESNKGVDVVISTTTYDGNEINFGTGQSVRFANGGGVESGDLDDGDYQGYQLEASIIGGESASLTLKLLSNGEVLGETSEPTASQEGVYIVTVGTLPEL